MSPLFRRKPDKQFYEQAMAFVLALKDEISVSGIHTMSIPPHKPLFSLQFVGATPPEKSDDPRLIESLIIRRKLKKPLLDFFNDELKRLADAGSYIWDDDLFRKGYIGMREDEDGFTALCMPHKVRHEKGHRGEIQTALNELEVALHAHLEPFRDKPPQRM